MSKSESESLRPKSSAMFERAQRVLVGGVNSPVRAFGSVAGNPVFLKSASGAYVTDVDGNKYVDLVGSWGPAIAGHGHPDVLAAVIDAAKNGLSFGACCESESELGELIVSALPGMEMVRFVNSGTEATMSSLRLARAVTDRPKIVKMIGCYHGHSDGLLVAAGSGAATVGIPNSAGVPPTVAANTLLAPYNDIDAVTFLFENHPGEIAGVMVEPVAGNMGFVRPATGYLESLRTLCDTHGAMLIFDEVMTGFRVAWGGYQVHADIRPDITCLGKVMGGGMPVAAYGASREIMELVSPLGPMYQAGTLSGNPLGMASGLATLKLCQEDGFYNALNQKATRLATGMQAAADDAGVPFQTDALGGMLGLSFSEKKVENYVDATACDHQRYASFFHSMLDAGVWLPPSGYEAFFLSSMHTDEDIDHVIEASRHAFRESVA